jgi:hypothetical protein
LMLATYSLRRMCRWRMAVSSLDRRSKIFEYMSMGKGNRCEPAGQMAKCLLMGDGVAGRAREC